MKVPQPARSCGVGIFSNLILNIVSIQLGLGLVFACLTSAGNAEREFARIAAARIDELVGADLKREGLAPNPIAGDGIFLRRAYLGIIGRIPTEAESRDYLGDSSSGKRAELIDKLVTSPGFDSHLFNWAGDLLRVKSRQEAAGMGWHVWLRKSLADDKPWNVLVEEMLGATGHTASNPAVGYYLRDRDMQLDNFSNTMQVFLGRRIGCAQCHDHPFEDWSQREYYEMAAFGGGLKYNSREVDGVVERVGSDLKVPFVGTGKNANENRRLEAKYENDFMKKIETVLNPLFRDFRKNEVYDDERSLLRFPADYRYKDAEPGAEVAPRTHFGRTVENIPPGARRETFAEWVASPENPYFTKVIVNRLWARTFGHGLLNPVDDWTEDSQPAHPLVLEFLVELMKDTGYDLRKFCGILCGTELFQQECSIDEPVQGVAQFVKGPDLRRMTGEQLYDSLIVLNRGEVEDGIAPALLANWKQYSSSIAMLLESDSQTLMDLGKVAGKADEEYLKLNREFRELARIASGLKREERSVINGRINSLKSAMSVLRAEKDPVNLVNNDPMAMENSKMVVEQSEMAAGGSMIESMEEKKRKERDRSDILRASELPSPINPDSLVREFGGSDRETPSSAMEVATVPQALALLNDRKTDLGNPKKSLLAKRLAELQTPAEKLEAAFVRIYSRTPTREEQVRYTKTAGEPGRLRELVRAMVTSDHFLFIQ